MMGTGRPWTVTELGTQHPLPGQGEGPGHHSRPGYVVARSRPLATCGWATPSRWNPIPAPEALPGYEEPKQMVFCDFYPATTDGGSGKKGDFETLREAIEKLAERLIFTYEMQHSEALGFGFRCGFLGLLHMDIVQERLEREGGVEIVQTAPTVTYKVDQRRANVEIHNPADLPDANQVTDILEPIVKLEMICPEDSDRRPDQTLRRRRGIFADQVYIPRTADPRLRAATGGDHLRLLRQVEVDHPRLRHHGLRDHRLPADNLSKVRSWSTGSRSRPSA